jgi:hypothetical protein
MAAQKILDTTTVDYQPLSIKVSFKEALKASASVNRLAIIIACVFFSLFFTIIFFTISASDHVNLLLVIGIMLFVISVVLFVVAIAMYTQGADYIKRSMFAAKNGFTYVTEEKKSLHGVFANIGNSNALSNIIRGMYANGTFWIANYSYVTGSGDSRENHSFGVFSAQLPKVLPNILLDSKANNYFGLGNLPSKYAKSQKFELEGDFVNYFTLYVPEDYERDVLYFLTPELMAILVSVCKDYDIEIVGYELRFYTSATIDFSQEALNKIFTIIDTVGKEFSDNTRAYIDERGAVSSATIMQPSATLKRGYLFGLSANNIAVISILFLISVSFIFAYNSMNGG